MCRSRHTAQRGSVLHTPHLKAASREPHYELASGPHAVAAALRFSVAERAGGPPFAAAGQYLGGSDGDMGTRSRSGFLTFDSYRLVRKQPKNRK